jgi:very-short-patch-repair endonuclease
VPSPEAEFARYRRRNQTGVEARMWSRLRGRHLGVKFRRQHPIGPYVADFACVEARLVVEIDGDTHEEAYDVHRDRWMESRGWRVMRAYLQEVDEELDSLVDAIRLELERPRSMLTIEDRNPSTSS